MLYYKWGTTPDGFRSAALMEAFATKLPWRFAGGGAGGCGEGLTGVRDTTCAILARDL